MSGWIKLHRQIQDHWLWNKKPFSRGQAWIDLLIMVNHENQKILLGSELIDVGRGERVTSIRKLCKRWGWSNTKTKTFLKLLEDNQMINVKSDSKKTIISIMNYNNYQGYDNDKNDAKATQKHQTNDTEATQKHTNNNDKNEKNDKNDNKKISSSKVFDERDKPFILSAKLRRMILSNNPKARVPKNLQKWAKEIDRMMRLDKRTYDEVDRIIDFSQNDPFWQTNILSAAKLRSQFDTLYMKAKREKKTSETSPYPKVILR